MANGEWQMTHDRSYAVEVFLMPSSAVLSSLGRIGKIKEPTVSLLSHLSLQTPEPLESQLRNS